MLIYIYITYYILHITYYILPIDWDRARALFGPWARVPGPYPLWLSIWASRAIDMQSIGNQ